MFKVGDVEQQICPEVRLHEWFLVRKINVYVCDSVVFSVEGGLVLLFLLWRISSASPHWSRASALSTLHASVSAALLWSALQ